MKNILDHSTIVDVRSKGEFLQEHFPGSRNIFADLLLFPLWHTVITGFFQALIIPSFSLSACKGIFLEPSI